MILTNKYNLPAAVAAAVGADNYLRGENHYSVTQLIEAPRVVQLKRRYWDELTEDVIDRVWSIFGSAVHHIMETHASDDDFVEQRYYIERLGRTVGGMVDCFNAGVVSDYKVTSAWSIVYGSRKEHWEQQLNLYAHILRANDIPVEKLHIIAFLRDWDKNKAKQDYTYPQAPLLVLPLRLWSPEEAEQYLLDRLTIHIANEQLPDSELTTCLNEEMWERPSTYAVVKEGRKSAVRVFNTQGEADEFMTTIPPKTLKDHDVVVRVGKRMRCEDYCACNKYCNTYQEYLHCG